MWRSEKIKDSWESLDIAIDEDGCEYCGQVLNTGLCVACCSAMNSIVYEICRDLILNEGITNQPREEKDDDFSPQKPRQMAIHRFLQEFPNSLAKRCRRQKKLLQTHGRWFAHLVAYCMVSYLRRDKDYMPHQIIADDVYLMVRDQVFNFLSLDNEAINAESLETIHGFYHIPDADPDARMVIYYMIIELERSGKLVIDRGAKFCRNCGEEMETDETNTLCSGCRQEEQLNVRRTIASAMPKSLIQEQQEKPSPIRSGMHVRKF